MSIFVMKKYMSALGRWTEKGPIGLKHLGSVTR